MSGIAQSPLAVSGLAGSHSDVLSGHSASPPVPVTSPSFRHIAGQFAGQTIRMELLEVQQAERGRKCALVDRRPIDPPPIVLLRIYIVHNPGTAGEHETEIEDYSTVTTAGLLCFIRLALPAASDPALVQTGPLSTHMHANATADTLTAFLIGTKCVSPHLALYKKVPRLMFAFGDIAVCEMGHFKPWYQVFDIQDGVHEPPEISVPVLASCNGDPFRIYSTKDFPGLAGSSELTRALSAAGADVKVREEGSHRKASSASHATVPM